MQIGPTGATGPANTLTIGGVTSGVTPSATITGSAPAQTLNLVLPKGDTGSNGNQGLKGDTGDAGQDAVWNYTGTYSGGASYAVGDLAVFNGQLFYRKNSNGGNVGDTPAESSQFWDLIAAKGEDGGGVGSITTSTSTNLNGLIYGNGTSISTIQATSNASANHAVLRDSGGRISAKQIRLYNDENSGVYTQINPAVSASTVAFQFPSTAGTIATNSTAVMLSGTQTINGDKTFNGQVTLSAAQSLTNGASAVTRSLGDERYLPAIHDFTTSPVTANSVSLVTAAELVLSGGTYYLEAYAATYAAIGTAANTTIRFSSSAAGAAAFDGSDDYGNTPLVHVDVESDPLAAAFIRQSTGTANTFSRRLAGIVTITADTTLKLEFRQSATSANVITCRAGAYMIAKKLLGHSLSA